MKIIRYRQMFVLAIVLLGGLSLPNAFANIINMNEYFDTNTIGSTAGWTVGGPMTGAVTNDLSRSQPNSLLMVQTQKLSLGYVYKALSPTISTSTNAWVDMRLSVNLGEPHDQFNFFLVDSSFSSYIQFYFGSGGLIFVATNGAHYDILGNYTSQTWYDVSLRFNPSQQVFNFSVSTNGTSIINASNLPVYDSTRPNFSYFAIYSYGNTDGGNATMHLDNVFIEVPEPSGMALAVLGLTGFMCFYRRS